MSQHEQRQPLQLHPSSEPVETRAGGEEAFKLASAAWPVSDDSFWLPAHSAETGTHLWVPVRSTDTVDEVRAKLLTYLSREPGGSPGPELDLRAFREADRRFEELDEGRKRLEDHGILNDAWRLWFST